MKRYINTFVVQKLMFQDFPFVNPRFPAFFCCGEINPSKKMYGRICEQHAHLLGVYYATRHRHQWTYENPNLHMVTMKKGRFFSFQKNKYQEISF